jgi:hypothetical protein
VQPTGGSSLEAILKNRNTAFSQLTIHFKWRSTKMVSAKNPEWEICRILTFDN